LSHPESESAVIFDMDGVILDSERVWERVMRELFAACDRPWNDFDPDAFAGGDNSRQWASYLRRVGGLPLAEDEIVKRVTHSLLDCYAEALPMVPGAEQAVERLAASYRLGLASSSPRQIIAFVLARSGLDRFFAAWTSSDDVPRGKPEPDVYLRACSLVGADPARCVAVEDSPSGIKAAHAAGLKVIAIPHPSFPLDPASLDFADLALASIDELMAETVESVLTS
jgi:HAD superfamily hydrolase (TIGR01509 family)